MAEDLNPPIPESTPKPGIPFQIPGAAPDVGLEAAKQGRAYRAFTPDGEDVLNTAYDLNSMNSLIGHITNPNNYGLIPRLAGEWAYRMGAHPDEPRLSKKEAEKKYEGIAAYDGMLEGVAQLRKAELDKQREAQAWMALGPDLNLWQNLKVMTSSQLDPINLMVNAATGGSSFAAKAAQNVAGNLLTDIPQTLLQQREGQKVNYGETVMSSILGGVVGTGVAHGIGWGLKKTFGAVFADTTEKVKNMFDRAEGAENNLPNSVKEQKLRLALQQAESNARISFDKIDQVMLDRVNGEHKLLTYTPGEYIHPSERQFYMAESPDTGQFAKMGPELGNRGVHIVDSEALATNMAASPEGGSPGRVIKTYISENTKLLDIGTKVNDETLTKILDKLNERMGGDVLGLPHKATLQDVFDQIRLAEEHGALPHGYQTILTDIIKKEGFDGISYVNTKDNGDVISKGVYLFDKGSDKIQPIESNVATSEGVPTIDPNTIYLPDANNTIALASPTHMSFSEEAQALIKESSSKVIDETPVMTPEHQALEASTRKRLEELNNPTVQAEMDKIDREFNQDKNTRKMGEMARDCMLGELT